jgi:hypothetical protein
MRSSGSLRDQENNMKASAFLIFFFISAAYLCSQAILKIHSADILKQNPLGGKIIYGRVDIEYDVYRVKCDSAVVNKDLTNARLFRNIMFSDTSRTIYCDNATVSKTPNGNVAYLFGNVKIKEKDFLIRSNEASLNEMSEKADVSGTVTVSYKPYPSILYCSSLEHDTKNGIISSTSVDSVLYIDSLRFYKLYTKNIYYDLNQKKLDIAGKFKARSFDFEKPLLDHRQIVPEKIPAIVKDMIFVKDTRFSAGRASLEFDPFSFETRGKCSAVQIDLTGNDSTFFDAEKITYSEETGIGDAKGSVFIRKEKMKITAGSSKYLEDSGTVKFFEEPVILYEDHKITGDSVSILIDPDEMFPKEAAVYSNPYYTSLPDPAYPDEINILKGKLMNLWFSDKEISKIIVSKEAEGLYFIREGEKKSGDASNYLLGDVLELNFSDGEIKNASITGGCEGVYFPGAIKKEALKKIKK